MGDLYDVLSRAPVFEALDQDEVNVLTSGSTEMTYSPGQLLFSEGDVSNGMFVVLDGAVELVASFTGGVERVFGTVRSGHVLGLLSVIDDGVRPATARAVEPTTALTMDRTIVAGMRDTAPVTWAKIVSGLAGQLAAQTRLVVEQYRRNIEWSLEVSGCSGINLNRLLTDSAEVEIELINGSLVKGVILGIEAEPQGHDILVGSDGGKLHIIPYRSVVQITAARAGFEPVLAE